MRISVHPLTYIFLLVSFLAGYFEYMFILLIVIVIHESGHYICGLIEGNESPFIVVYPFGGVTIMNNDLNTPIYKELLFAISGFIFQMIFYFLIYILNINDLVNNHTFEIFNKINIILCSFNLLPILPLDGGRILNILLSIFLKYKLSIKISIFISIIFIIVFFFCSKTFLSFVLTIFLIKSIYLEMMNINNKYNQFLFERYANNYIFYKYKHIDSVNSFYRDHYHIINNVNESVFLHNLFDIKT